MSAINQFLFILLLGVSLKAQALTFTTIQQNGSVNKDIAVAPGELYEVSFDLVGHTTDDVRFVVSEGANVLVDESALADGAHQYYFTAVGSTVTLTFQRLDPGIDSRMFVVNGLSFLKQEEKVCTNQVGQKQYELSDHLGNVRATISDNPDMDEAEVILAVDYYPFGMEQVGRIDRSPKYRYGFNGLEKEDEVKGLVGTDYFTFYRVYDSRIGRWFSVDPKVRKFADWTPYNFVFNNPIRNVDVLGDEPTKIEKLFAQGLRSKTFLALVIANDLTPEKYKDKVREGNRSKTKLKSKIITVKITGTNKDVLALTHELTNLKNSDYTFQNVKDVSTGKISPEEYAKRQVQSEAEGIVNKIIVASELGIIYEKNKNMQKKYENGVLTKEQLFEKVNSKLKNAKVVATGENAIDQYIKRGQKLRKNFKKRYPNYGKKKGEKKK